MNESYSPEIDKWADVVYSNGELASKRDVLKAVELLKSLTPLERASVISLLKKHYNITINNK